MNPDVFGNLRDWGRVIETIEGLQATGELHRHQAGLVRILRYRGNWRLRETVLRCVHNVRTPSDELLGAVLSIMMDDDIYYEARLLAAEALAAVLSTTDSPGTPRAVVTKQLVSRKMDALLKMPGPPFFLDPLRRLREPLANPASLRRGAERM